jgi:chromosome segregation ATPase
VLGTLEQYWRKLAAGINKTFRHEPPPVEPRLEELEREILTFSRENQTLAGKVEEIRVDSERRGSDELGKIEILEENQRQTETARIADARRLDELKRLHDEVAAGQKREHEQFTALEASLAETTSRLEARDNQLKFLQDSAREEHQALKTALAEASSRLETRDNELERLLDSAQEQIAALEASLAETAKRFETTDGKLAELRASLHQQLTRLGASLSSGNVQLEATNRHIRTLEKKLEVEYRLQQNLLEDMQAQLRRQDERLSRAMATAVFAIVLAIVAGAVLIWLKP